jgi:hypothetical protein
MLYSRITSVVPYIAAQTKLEIKSWLGSSINCNFNKGRLSKQEKTETIFMNYYVTIRSNLEYAVGIAMAGLKHNTCSNLLSRKVEKCYWNPQ